jgi:hypothetical protein
MSHIEIVEVLIPSPIQIVEIQIPGPPGPQGPPGSAGTSYDHLQSSASAVWTVPHNLGYLPTVSVRTIGGLEVEGGEVLHLSVNTLTITFDVAFTGTARCN